MHCSAKPLVKIPFGELKSRPDADLMISVSLEGGKNQNEDTVIHLGPAFGENEFSLLLFASKRYI